MQPVWLCIRSGRQLEETFENAQWRKTQQMQPMRLCILSGKQFEETFENPQCDLLQRCYRLNSITWKDDDSNLYKIPSYHLWWCYHQKLLWEINRNLGFCPLGFIPHTVTVMVMVVDMVVGHLPKGRTPANKNVFFLALPEKGGPARICWYFFKECIFGQLKESISSKMPIIWILKWSLGCLYEVLLVLDWFSNFSH